MDQTMTDMFAGGHMYDNLKTFLLGYLADACTCGYNYKNGALEATVESLDTDHIIQTIKARKHCLEVLRNRTEEEKLAAVEKDFAIRLQRYEAALAKKKKVAAVVDKLEAIKQQLEAWPVEFPTVYTFKQNVLANLQLRITSVAGLRNVAIEPVKYSVEAWHEVLLEEAVEDITRGEDNLRKRIAAVEEGNAHRKAVAAAINAME